MKRVRVGRPGPRPGASALRRLPSRSLPRRRRRPLPRREGTTAPCARAIGPWTPPATGAKMPRRAERDDTPASTRYEPLGSRTVVPTPQQLEIAAHSLIAVLEPDDLKKAIEEQTAKIEVGREEEKEEGRLLPEARESLKHTVAFIQRVTRR